MSRRYDDEEEFGFDEAGENIEGEDESFELDEEEEFFEDDEDEDEDGDELDDDEDEGEGNEFADLDSVVEEGEELIESGEYAKAIELLQGGLEVFPEEVSLHFLLGLASLESLKEDIDTSELWEDDSDMVEMYEQAVASFEEALNLDPEHVGSLNALGMLYALRGNHESAINCWEKSLEVEPDQSTVNDDIRASRKKLESD